MGIATDERTNLPAQLWRRFTLAGFLTFVFGICAGLANYRAAREDFFSNAFEARWPSTIFACFLAWFLMGMGQTAWKRYMRCRTAQNLSAPIRWGYHAQFMQPIVAAILVVIYVALKLIPTDEGDDLQDFDVQRAMELLPYLAVIIGYGHQTTVAASSLPGRFVSRGIADALVMLLALVWVAFVAQSAAGVLPHVAIAIRMMELGKPNIVISEMHVSTHDFGGDSVFVSGGIVAGALAGLLLISAAGSQLRWRYFPRGLMWLAFWLLALIGCWWHLVWFYTEGFPRFSPHLANEAFNISAPKVAFLAGLLSVATGLMATRSSSPPIVAEELGPAIDSTPPLHQRRIVQSLCLVSILWWSFRYLGWEHIDDWSEFWKRMGWWIEAHATYPIGMAQAAAFLVVGSALLRSFRTPYTESSPPALDAPRIARQAVVWLLTLGTVAPLLVWFGGTVIFWI